MKKNIYTILALLCALLPAKAATTDSAYVERHSLWRQTYSEALQNPALMTHAYLKPFTELSLQCDYRHQTEAFQVEQGTGYLKPELSAQSYIRLTPSSVVWGQASYGNGMQYNQAYNNVADFDLLYPDVIADSIGGDTHCERYFFTGGYATKTGNWLLGGELKFRAEQDYRTYDPRMRSIVSDLTLKAGAARQIGRYHLGLAIEGNIYRQTADVDFYGEQNGMGELQMTGLGTNYTRFSGSNRDIFYEGKGAAVAFDLQPLTASGWMIHLSHALHQYERLLDEYNSLPLTTLYRQQNRLMVGWRQQSGTNEKALMLHADYDKRASDEHVAGTSSGQDYPILTQLTMYHQHRWDVGATALYGIGAWHLQLRAGYLNHREQYAYVEREMNYSRVYGHLTAQWLKVVNEAWHLNIYATGGYAANVDSKIVMPYANMSSGIKACINHNYKYLKASYAQAQSGIRADYQPTSWTVGLYGKLATAWQFCSKGEHETNLHVSLGIIF
jgi:hypothetical protein